MHLFEGHVGGGFGVRGELYPEDVLVCVAALRLRRSIKWIEDRHEHFVATNHSRQQRHRIRAAVDADGRLLAIDDTFFHDQGAYVRTHGARVVDLAAGMLPGPYRLPAYRVAGHFRLTNKTPAATYRSPGRYETTFVRERLIDAIAAAARPRSRSKVRRRNLVTAGRDAACPPGSTRWASMSCSIPATITACSISALDRFGWDRAAGELARAARGRASCVGAGIAFFVEKSGLGPTDGARVSVDATGPVELVSGAASVGQGMETVLAQICAEALGVDYRGIRVVRGRTDRIEFGNGAHASRVTVMSGSATYQAALAVQRHGAGDGGAAAAGARRTSLTIADGRSCAWRRRTSR